MPELPRTQKLTLIYFAATLLAITLATQLGDRLEQPGIVLVGVVSPLLLAAAFSYYEFGWRGVRGLFGRPAGFRVGLLPLMCALLLPFVLMMASIGLDRGEWTPPDVSNSWKKVPILLVLMTGEEFGWRRFAFARLLSSASFMTSALLVGVVWLCWHFPGHLIGMGTPDDMSFGLFALMLIPGSILLAYLYFWTRNVYLVILAHVSSNVAFNSLPLLPEVTGDSTAFTIYAGLLWLLALPLILNRRYWRKG